MDALESATVVRRGDTIVLICSDRITQQAAEYAKAELRAKLPGVEVVVIGGVQQAIVYQGSAA